MATDLFRPFAEFYLSPDVDCFNILYRMDVFVKQSDVGEYCWTWRASYNQDFSESERSRLLITDRCLTPVLPCSLLCQSTS